jgi:transposase
MLTKNDLYSNQYEYETLKANIYAVSLLDILKTQKLTAEFCVKYILNENFQLSDEDQTITIEMIKLYQPHIQNIDLVSELVKATNKKMMRKRIDSFEDFESYMNRHL